MTKPGKSKLEIGIEIAAADLLFGSYLMRRMITLLAESLLNEIKENMVWRDGYQNRLALCGLGGVGKTPQVAIRYAHSVRKQYASEGIAVYWIRASNRDRFKESYLDIAKRANIPINEGMTS